jgi:hypothetical protein
VKKVLLDTNVLMLLLAGHAAPELIGDSKRLKSFSVADFNRLTALCRPFGAYVTLTSILTEVSNLLDIGKHRASSMTQALQSYVRNAEELLVASLPVIESSAFGRLGLTDATILLSLRPDTTVITVDFALMGLLADMRIPAINLRHSYDFGDMNGR